MRITKRQLRRIIKEELSAVISEGSFGHIEKMKKLLYSHFSLTPEQFSFDVSEDFEGQYSVIRRGGLMKLMKATGRPNPTVMLEEVEEALQQAGYETEFGDDGVLTGFAPTIS